MITITCKLDESINLFDLVSALNTLGLRLHYTGRREYVATPAGFETVVLYEGAAEFMPCHPERHGNINRLRVPHRHGQLHGINPPSAPAA